MRKGGLMLSIKITSWNFYKGMEYSRKIPAEYRQFQGLSLEEKETSEYETNHIQMRPSEKLSGMFDPNRSSALNVALSVIH
jgi:hypothetical protein